jgi:all-trans-retinol 13,14-reductase
VKKYDVVCIGSGISSLTSAILLAMQGRSVAVLEQHYLPGGYLHAFRKLGHTFDTGAHYVGAMGKGQPFRVLLEHLGVYRDDIFLELDPNGFDEVRFPGFTARFAKSYERTIDELARTFPRERAAITEYCRLVRDAARNFPTYNFRPESDLTVLLPLLETSLKSVVERLTQNRELQSVLYTYCALHGVVPVDLPFGLHALVMDSLIQGAYGFRESGNRLAEAFVARLKELGGELFLRTRVTKLETSGDSVTRIHTDRGEFEADWVVGGIHPKSLFGMLDPDPHTPLYRSRVEKMEESMGIFGLYAVTKPRADLDPLRNYYFFSSSDPEKMLPKTPAFEAPTAVFLSRSNRGAVNPSSISLNFHAAGPYEWFKPWAESVHGRRSDEYRGFKARYADKILGLAAERGVELRTTLEGTLSSSALTNQHYNPSPEGSAYGIYHSFQATGLRALGPRTKVRNLVLTGQNTLFPGLLAAAIAGLRSAGNVAGLKPTLAKLQEMLHDSGGEVTNSPAYSLSLSSQTEPLL